MLLCVLLFYCCSSFLPVRSWRSCPQSTVPCVCLLFFVTTWLSHSQTAPFTSFSPLEKHYKVFLWKVREVHLLISIICSPSFRFKKLCLRCIPKKIYKLNWDSYCGSMTVSLHYNLVFMFLLFWQVFKLMDTSFKWGKYCLKVTRCSCIGYKYVALKWRNVNK